MASAAFSDADHEANIRNQTRMIDLAGSVDSSHPRARCPSVQEIPNTRTRGGTENHDNALICKHCRNHVKLRLRTTGMASPFNIISNDGTPAAVPPDAHPRPDWLRVKFFGGERYQHVKRIMRTLGLHTVCESARCPNMGECWEHGAATFMILGDICTRACGFCAVPSGKPVGPPDEQEPVRVAEAAANMGLRYVVVTSVNRDDQADGGAHIFAQTITEIRRTF
jgi:hypothetical protein